MGITRVLDTEDLVLGGAVHLVPRVTARVGVAYAGAIAEAPWRFFDADSKHVSKPPARSIGLGQEMKVTRRT